MSGVAARRAPKRLIGERRMLVAANFRPWPYWLGTAAWVGFFVSPVVPGWLIGQVFDELQETGTSTRLVVLLVALGLAELGMIWGIAVGHRVYMRGLESSKAWRRANVGDAQLASGGATAGARNVAVGDVGEEGFDGGDDLAAGVLHQDQRGNADVLNRLAVRLAHLFSV